MAKAKIGTTEAKTGDTLSAKTSGLIDDIRKPFVEFSKGYRLLEESRAELAPRFLKAFASWQADTGGTFIGFVRVLVPEVPEARDGYRAHPAYLAADYLRRLRSQASRQQVDESERPATAFVALARVYATLMPLVDPDGLLWQSIVKELHWTETQAERLQKLAATTGGVRLTPKVRTHLRLAS